MASQQPVPQSAAPVAAAAAAVTEIHSTPIGCFWKLLRFCNTLAILALGVAVVFLFMQVQYLNYEIQDQAGTIADLQDQVKNQQHQEIQALSQEVQEEHSLTLYQIAGTFTLLTCLLTMFHVSMHLRNFSEPMVQRKIITILWMSPIYGVTSFLSLVFPSVDGYLAVVKDFYEAYVVYTFLSFLIAVLGRGNREVAVDVLARHAGHLNKPTRCLNRFYHPPPEVSDRAKAGAVIVECTILAMQFVFCRPFTSIGTFVSNDLWEQHHPSSSDTSHDGYSWTSFIMTPSFALSMITNVSVFLAFTGLLKFYHAVRDELQWCQPFWKFMAIKGIVFLTFWQGLLITILVTLRHDQLVTSTAASSSATSTSVGNWGTAAPVIPTAAAGTGTLAPQAGTNDDTSGVIGDGTVADGTGNGDPDGTEDLASEWTAAPPPAGGETAPVVDGTAAPANDSNNTGTRFLQSTSPFSSADSARELAQKIQNALICLEMLLFSIAHWCVFPHEEWQEGYRPNPDATAGLGLSDFVSDVSYIVSTNSEARAHRRRNQQQARLLRKGLGRGGGGDKAGMVLIDSSEASDGTDDQGEAEAARAAYGKDARVYKYSLTGPLDGEGGTCGALSGSSSCDGSAEEGDEGDDDLFGSSSSPSPPQHQEGITRTASSSASSSRVSSGRPLPGQPQQREDLREPSGSLATVDELPSADTNEDEFGFEDLWVTPPPPAAAAASAPAVAK